MFNQLFNQKPPIHIGHVNVEHRRDSDVKNLKQLFMCDTNFAYEHGGPFVRAFLKEIPITKYPLVIDTKIHMLKRGWYPGIPGWHIDFAPGWESLVEWDKVDPEERHFAAFSSNVSCTEYIATPVLLHTPRVYRINGILSKQVEAIYENLGIIKPSAHQIYEFGQMNLHRVTPATGSGWRLFVRASATKLRKPVNEIRTQASQVYILAKDEHSGW